MPTVLCNGCGTSTKQSGIVQHCRLSRNPACRTFLKDLLDTAKEVADQVRTGAENLEGLEAHIQGNNEIGTGMMFSLDLN
jgi:hypothetical protein